MGVPKKIEKITEKLFERIGKLPVIDTHEHMTMEADFISGSYDFTHLMNYLSLDLGLAGFPAEPWGLAQSSVSEGQDIEKKWQRIKPFWPYVRGTVYGQAYRRLLRQFFKEDDIDKRNIYKISERMVEYQYKGVYDKYLHSQNGIRVMLNVHDHTPISEPNYFAPVYYTSYFAGVYDANTARKAMGEDLPKDFSDFRELIRQRLDTAVNNGIVGLKIGMIARQRPLDFCSHSEKDIQSSYLYLREKADGNWQSKENNIRLKPFQDAAHWAVFEKAGELGLPIQIHSGLEFMQPWDGRPSCLIPSLIRFPQTKFVIFHGSYPYMAELTGLAKSFSNVYLDLAWFHLLSRHQARVWLAEWLNVLPHNKIFAFGGDGNLFFGICTHLEIARENMAAVLADRIVEGLCDIDEAEQTARWLLHDNAWNTFQFKNWKNKSVI
jgi:hypothetical protein